MTTYELRDFDDRCYNTYSKLEYAKENAQELANELGIDIFIYQITEENLECFIPDKDES